MLVNLGADPAEFEVPEAAEVQLAWSEPERTETGLRLQPDDVAVVRVQGVRT